MATVGGGWVRGVRLGVCTDHVHGCGEVLDVHALRLSAQRDEVRLVLQQRRQELHHTTPTHKHALHQQAATLAEVATACSAAVVAQLGDVLGVVADLMCDEAGGEVSAIEDVIAEVGRREVDHHTRDVQPGRQHVGRV